MATGVVSWSQTAATNATADANVDWAEGMAPSAVNNSARAEMASVAKWRDDLNGSLSTGGSANAYTLTTNQTFASLTNGLMVCFVASFTNTGTCTLNVDGLGASPLRIAGSVEAPAGSVVANAVYFATYRSASNQWIIVNGVSAIPAGSVIAYGGATAPNGWLLCDGSAISRTTYAALFAAVSTTYGAGDGSTTFNVPDLRGRVIAGQDDMGGSSANRLTNQTGGLDGDTLGATGGSETHTLTSAQMPAHTHTATVTDPGHTHTTPTNDGGSRADGASVTPTNSDGVTGNATTGITVANSSTGGDGAHNNVQPTLILNYIIRAI
jgi:microcystin-dependent protein